MGFRTLDLSEHPMLRQVDDVLRETRSVRYLGEVRRQRTGFAAVERLLVNGYLPDPLPIDADRTWIDTNQWDFVVYVQSNANARRDGLTYATWKAAAKKCGLFEDILRGTPGINAIKEYRRRSLVPELIRFGFLEEVEGPYQNKGGTLEWKRLLLVPTWPPDREAPIRTSVGKTLATMRAYHRDWFMMPEAIFNQAVWQKVGSHTGRRIIAALYAFFDEVTYSAVNPNHLRIRDDRFEVSEAFMKACGTTATVRHVADTIQWLWSKKLLFATESEVEAGRPYPAGQEYVTWARPVARNVPSDVVAFVPLYVPLGESDE